MGGPRGSARTPCQGIFPLRCKLVISRAIAADTNPPRVRPRKLAKLASLCPVMPRPSRTVATVGIQGETMYRSLLEADAALPLTLAFAAVLFLVGTLARVLRQLTTAEQNNKLGHT